MGNPFNRRYQSLIDSEKRIANISFGIDAGFYTAFLSTIYLWKNYLVNSDNLSSKIVAGIGSLTSLSLLIASLYYNNRLNDCKNEVQQYRRRGFEQIQEESINELLKLGLPNRN